MEGRSVYISISFGTTALMTKSQNQTTSGYLCRITKKPWKSTWVILFLLGAVFVFTHIICVSWRKVQFQTFTITIYLRRLESLVSEGFLGPGGKAWKGWWLARATVAQPALRLCTQTTAQAQLFKHFLEITCWSSYIHTPVFFFLVTLTWDNFSYCLRFHTQQEDGIKNSSKAFKSGECLLLIA